MVNKYFFGRKRKLKFIPLIIFQSKKSDCKHWGSCTCAISRILLYANVHKAGFKHVNEKYKNYDLILSRIVEDGRELDEKVKDLYVNYIFELY